MTEENQSPELFQGPIEAGETAVIPHEPPEGQQAFRDHFVVEGLEMDQEDIKSIVLPKFVLNHLNPGLGFREKGMLYVTFNGNHKNGTYREIVRLVNEGMEELRIHYVDPETGAILSTWDFAKPRIHAIDFGYAAHQRPEPTEFSVEIDYSNLEIDGFTI